jgi:hypothetical protein
MFFLFLLYDRSRNRIHIRPLASGSGWPKNVWILRIRFQCYQAVFRIRIRIHRIHVFFGLPDPLVRGMDPDPAMDPDPSIMMQK